MIRIGIGYDIHRLARGRDLIIGGVKIPFEMGLDGHSDADVLVHSICDALLGATALGDIGQHFPPDDEQYSGISSLILLDKVKVILSDQGFEINNIDSVIIAEKPKLAPFIPSMRQNISGVLDIDVKCVSIKATTNERLGSLGRLEGIAAESVVSVIEKR